MASAVVLDATGRHVLLVRQPTQPRWGLVSGHVEGGEPAGESARRHVREQTGLSRFQVVHPHLAVQQDLLDCGDVQALHVDHIFAVRVDPSEVVVEGPLDPSGEAVWFPVRQLPEPLAPGVRGHVLAALRGTDER